MMVKKKKQQAKRVCIIYYTVFDNNPLLIREAGALTEQGFNVDIICLRKRKSDDIFQCIEGINLYKIQIRKKSEKSKIKYFYNLFVFILKVCIILTYFSLKHKYDVVHITSPPDILVFSAIISKILGGSILLDIHDIGPELYMRKLHAGYNHPLVKLLLRAERLSCRFSDYIITVTDIWKNKILSRSAPEGNCSVIMNVPDNRIFYLREKDLKTRCENSLNIYYHGSLEEHFGVDILINAVPLIIKEIPFTKVYIYGKGREKNNLEKLSSALGLQDIVIIHDVVHFKDLPHILAHADMGVVPTKNDVFSDEALSMKSLEYISLGIPIVISGTQAHSYYYDPSLVSFFTPNNPDSLARSVIELFSNKSMRDEHIHNALDFIKHKGWKNTKKHYLEIINKLVIKACMRRIKKPA